MVDPVQLYLDPGLSSGVVLASGMELIYATSIPADELFDKLHPWRAHITAMYSEHPYVYPQGKGDPNKLWGMCREIGRLEGWLELTATTYYPREWKGTLNKDVCWARAEKRLTREEKDRIHYPGSKKDDVHDAIALFLVVTKRMRLV